MNSNILCALVVFACLYYASEARYADTKSAKMDDMDYKWTTDLKPKSIKFGEMQNDGLSARSDESQNQSDLRSTWTTPQKIKHRSSQVERKYRLREMSSNERNTIYKDTI